MLRSLSLTIAALGLSATASAQITPVASDSFEYPVPGLLYQQAGGTGWSNAWWVSGAANDELVMFDQSIQPPFAGADNLGGYGRVRRASSARPIASSISLLTPSSSTPSPVAGEPTVETIWISFSTVNFQGQPQDHYGGLSLWRAGQNPAESLFLGSPWNSQGWGIDDEGDLAGSAPASIVPGSNDQVAARLVVRRWTTWPARTVAACGLTPQVDYPTGTADLDEMVTGWRLRRDSPLERRVTTVTCTSGTTSWWAKGTPTGGLGINYCSANPNSTGATGSISATGSDQAGLNDLTLTAGDLPTNSFGFFLASQTQSQVANPGGSAGNLCLGGAIGRYVAPRAGPELGLHGRLPRSPSTSPTRRSPRARSRCSRATPGTSPPGTATPSPAPPRPTSRTASRSPSTDPQACLRGARSSPALHDERPRSSHGSPGPLAFRVRRCRLRGDAYSSPSPPAYPLAARER